MFDSQNSPTAAVVIQLFGKFSISSPNEQDLSPRGARAKVIITMLCLAPENRVSRRFLEATLWSNRSEDQAASSLRQCLTEIRRSLKQYRGLLAADRQFVWLSPHIPHSVRQTDDLSGGMTLLEEVRIRDPAYESWIEKARQANQVKPVILTKRNHLAGSVEDSKQPMPPTLALKSFETASSNSDLVRELLHQQLARNLSDGSVVNVVSLTAESSVVLSDAAAYCLSIRTLDLDDTTVVLLQLQDTTTGQIFWSRREKFSGTLVDVIEDSRLYQLADETAEVSICRLMSDSANDTNGRVADQLLHQALRELFTFDAPRLLIADKLLETASELDPHPIFFAWRSYLRIPMWVERLEPISTNLISEATKHLETALELGKESSLVHAVASQHYLTLRRDHETAKNFADDAITLNPGNPLAHMSSSLTFLRTGDLSRAKKAADMGLSISRLSPHRHWWYMASCAVDIALGNYNEAIVNGEAALAFAPRYKPPLRHLYALYLKVGKYDKAEVIHKRMADLEPFFSLEYARITKTYPATTLRNSTLIELPDLDHVLDKLASQ